MILTIDIGNTNICVGAFENEKLKFCARMSTDKQKLTDEYAIDLKDIFALYEQEKKVEGAILSSVVPALTPCVAQAIKTVFGIRPVIVGPGIKTGMNIKIDNPAQLGSDIIADDLAAHTLYKGPLMVFDMGTATTISVVDKNGAILGGAIMPGIRLSLNALSQTAAQLPEIGLENAPDDIIGTNTIDSMKAGVIYGNASMVDGMIDRMEERMGETIKVIATGGLSGSIIPHCRHKIIHDPDLQLKGLYILYKKNI